MGIGGVVHRHYAVHRVGPDCVLNLSMCINRIPANEREREKESHISIKFASQSELTHLRSDSYI